MKELSNRILFTIALLLVFRIGSFIPIAGIDSGLLEKFTASNQGGVLGMLNVLSGGSLGRMSIFALALMPYITASIMIQLLSITYKPLETLKKDSESGRKKLNQLSRYLTIVLAIIQAYGTSVKLEGVMIDNQSLIVINLVLFRFLAILTLLVGTILLMWIGEQITAKGIGNGSSLIIYAGIVSSIPHAFISTFTLAHKGIISPVVSIMVVLVMVGLVGIIVFFETAQRKVAVNYSSARFMQLGANKMDFNHIPLKLNIAGVIPPMFSTATLSFPATLVQFFSYGESEIGQWMLYNLTQGKLMFMVLYIILIIFFSFIYTAVIFNSEEMAENLKKSGAFISGKRPGKSTAEYFDYILSRTTVIGALYLAMVCIIPEFLIAKFAISFALGGTSLLIAVNVILETFSQIQAYAISNKYDVLMKKMRTK